jgi:hypothetical protein
LVTEQSIPHRYPLDSGMGVEAGGRPRLPNELTWPVATWVDSAADYLAMTGVPPGCQVVWRCSRNLAM